MQKILFYTKTTVRVWEQVFLERKLALMVILAHIVFLSHHISTIEGGMVLTNNYETYEIIKSLRARWTRDIPSNNSIYKVKKKDFDSEYKFILPGYNLRPSEINASSE